MSPSSRVFLVLSCLACLSLSACNLYVELTEPPTTVPQKASVRVSPETLSIKVGMKGTLTAERLGVDGQLDPDAEIRWLTQDATVATVADGEVTGIGPGQTKIIAKSGDLLAEAVVTVEKADGPVVSQVQVTPETLELEIDSSAQLNVTVLGEDNMMLTPAQSPVTYTIEKPGVVTVSATGLVTGKAIGVTKVTATSGAVTASSTITVIEANTKNVLDLAVGHEHACVISGRGDAYCWGNGTYGRWGVESDVNKRLDVHKVQGEQRFTQLTAGTEFTCGLKSNGEAYCWGRGQNGQLGQGMPSNSSTPVRVSTATLFERIEAGGQMGCGLTQEGKLWCWGDSRDRQLGGNTREPSPVAVAPNDTFTDIAVGNRHLCGIAGGSVYCWGNNAFNQVGQADASQLFDAPQLVKKEDGMALNATKVYASNNTTCALTLNDQTYCWGSNDNTRLGLDAEASSAAPVLLKGGQSFASLAMSTNHTCGLKDNGQVWCWGSNAFGGFGKKPLNTSTQPTRMGGSLLFEKIATKDTFICGITTTDKVYCWGNQGDNFLGNRAIGYLGRPTAVTRMADMELQRASAVSVGWRHTCLLGGEDRWACFGRATEGQLAVDESNEVLGLEGALLPLKLTSISSGERHSCGVDGSGMSQAGSVYCWGNNEHGQLGTGNRFDSTMPRSHVTPVSFSTVDVGLNAACAISTDGGSNNLRCWGTLRAGEPAKLTPTMMGIDDVSQVSVGFDHACAIDGLDQLWCWGDNDFGQLGSGDTSSSGVPSLVSNLGKVKHVSAGHQYTCAVELNGTVKCWGGNLFSRLGVGNSMVTSPMSISFDKNAVSVHAGRYHTCAVEGTAEKPLWCWGRTAGGLTGTDDMRVTIPPTKVAGLSAIQDADTGYDHTCVIGQFMTTPGIYCWGENYQGQLGQQSTSIMVTAVKVDFSMVSQ